VPLLVVGCVGFERILARSQTGLSNTALTVNSYPFLSVKLWLRFAMLWLAVLLDCVRNLVLRLTVWLYLVRGVLY